MIPFVQTGPALWLNLMHLDHLRLQRLAFCSTCKEEIVAPINEGGLTHCPNGHECNVLKGSKKNTDLVDAMFYHVRGDPEEKWIRVHPEFQETVGKIVRMMMLRIQETPPIVAAKEIPHA